MSHPVGPRPHSSVRQKSHTDIAPRFRGGTLCQSTGDVHGKETKCRRGRNGRTETPETQGRYAARCDGKGHSRGKRRVQVILTNAQCDRCRTIRYSPPCIYGPADFKCVKCRKDKHACYFNGVKRTGVAKRRTSQAESSHPATGGAGGPANKTPNGSGEGKAEGSNIGSGMGKTEGSNIRTDKGKPGPASRSYMGKPPLPRGSIRDIVTCKSHIAIIAHAERIVLTGYWCTKASAELDLIQERLLRAQLELALAQDAVDSLERRKSEVLRRMGCKD